MSNSNSHTTVNLTESPSAAAKASGPERASRQRLTSNLPGEVSDSTAAYSSPTDNIFRAFFETSHNPMGIVEIVNDDIMHIADNAASGRLFKQEPSWMRNRPATEIGIPEDAARKWLHYYQRSRRTGLPQRFEYIHQVSPDQEVVLLVTVCFINITPDGWSRFSYAAEDVTERRRSQNVLHGKARQYRDLYAAAQRREQELALQDKVRTALMHELDPSSVIRTVVEGIAGTLGYTHVSIYLLKGKTLELQHQVGYENVITSLQLGRGIAGQVARTGEAVFLEDVSTSPVFVAPIEGVVSEICVPLLEGGVVAGILNVESAGSTSLVADDLRVITGLGQFISIALGRARLYAEMKDSKERFQAFMNNGPALACIQDENGCYVYVNEPYERTFEVDAEKIIGKPDTMLNESLMNELKAHNDSVLARDETVEAIHMIPTPDGVPHDWLTYKFPIKDASGRRLVGCVALDITERRHAEQAMHQLAIRDELTGLYNRREMRRLLDEAAERYASLEQQPTALLMLDIDHFKLVNDNYGHKAGDSVLQWLSEFLAESIRLPHWLARYGGEELAIILPNSDEKVAFEVAEQIRREIEANPYSVIRGKGKALKIELTASFGVAAYSGGIDSEEGLIAAADLALYEAKRRGRNCVVLYDSQTLKTTAFLTTQVLQSPESADATTEEGGG